MRDKRPVGELSVEELERVLAIKKREARQKQMERMQRSGRVVQPDTPASITNGGTLTPPKAAVAPPTPVTETAAAPETPDTPTETAPEQTEAKSPPPITSGLPRFEDDPGQVAYESPRKAKSNRAWTRFVNGTLLLVEVGAVFGLVFLGLNMIGAIGKLEQETSAAQQSVDATRRASIPTIEPTPTLRLNQVVLPGGHTIDETTGQALINYSEIPDSVPAHLLPAIQSELLRPSIARPQPTSETALAISIPKLGIDQTIVQGSDWEALQQGVGQVLNGYNPSDPNGNVALSAHNDIYGEIFRHLDELEAGDEFSIQTESGVYRYRITHWEIVNPTDVHVLESRGKATATLISCYPYRVNTRRYVVYADRVEL